MNRIILAFLLIAMISTPLRAQDAGDASDMLSNINDLVSKMQGADGGDSGSDSADTAPAADASSSSDALSALQSLGSQGGQDSGPSTQYQLAVPPQAAEGSQQGNRIGKDVFERRRVERERRQQDFAREHERERREMAARTHIRTTAAGQKAQTTHAIRQAHRQPVSGYKSAVSSNRGAGHRGRSFQVAR